MFHKYNTYTLLQMGDAIAAANSQNMQYQQMQLMQNLTQIINNANNACAKGTDCYKNQQIMDAKNRYDAAVITEKNAPKMVEDSRKDYLIAAKGQSGANEVLKQQYQQMGEQEKAKLTQQFDQWQNDVSNKISSVTNDVASIQTLSTTNARLESILDTVNQQDDDATNALNLLERKIHYAAQDVSLINNVEYYIKLLYWLVFLTWTACIIYERRFTMKTGTLFVLFTIFILAQNYIMDRISFIIPADVRVKW